MKQLLEKNMDYLQTSSEKFSFPISLTTSSTTGT